MKKAYLNWSSGKDAAYALYLLQQQNTFAIEKLVTTLNEENERVSMHGVRKELLQEQAEKVGIPLYLISLPGNVSMKEYNQIMLQETLNLASSGFTHSIYGDIFLEDLKTYRQEQLQKADMEGVFPLWKKDTKILMQEFIDAGFKAVTVSVNAKLLDKSFCGRIIDHKFLSELPPGVDFAGENGEFHSFVYDGPIFSHPITFQKGEIVTRFFKPANSKDDNCFKEEQQSWDTEFYFCDLLPF